MCGHPLIAWSIIQAKGSALIDQVYLTTDDEEIAEVALRYGAAVIMRPVWDNGVTAGVAYKHAMDEIGTVNHIVTMLPTSPLKMPYDLDTMIKLYLESNVLTMTAAAPMKEMCVLKNTVPFESRYGADFNTPGERSNKLMFDAKYEIFDKYWNYSKLCGAWNISEYNWQMQQWIKTPKLDAEIDNTVKDTTGTQSYYAVEEWQCFEIDYPEDIPIIECLLADMIVKGRSIYEVYGVREPIKSYGNSLQARYADAN